LKNCLLSAAAQLHRPLSWLCFQMYALLLLQLMDHRKQVTRLGIPFRPEHPYETHARAARRLRRENYYADGLSLWLSIRDGSSFHNMRLATVNDDQAILAGLRQLWDKVAQEHPHGLTIFRVSVTLYDLSPANARQIDLLNNDDATRQKWEKASSAIDDLNSRYSKTIVSLGEWKPPAGGQVGGKISYVRIPSPEDFW
jgi:DNA polymerase IV